MTRMRMVRSRVGGAGTAASLGAPAPAAADLWVVTGSRATPYPAGQTRYLGVPVLYGDDHACLPDEFETSAFRRLSIKAEATFAGAIGGWNLSEEVFRADGPGPSAAAGILHIDSFNGTLRPVNGRVRFGLFMSSFCQATLADDYHASQNVDLSARVDLNGRPPQVPAIPDDLTSPPARLPEPPPPPKKRQSIWNARSKQVFANARDNVLRYGDNAGRVSGLCILQNIKREALEESVKAVAKDLAQSQVPILNQIPTDACSLALTSFSGWMKLEGMAFHALANDPPRPSFTTRVTPVVRVPFTVEATGSGTQAPVASALTVLVDANARARANMRALLVAAERALGAQKAGNALWQRRQTADARAFARASATQLARVRAGLPALAAALRQVGYTDHGPTPDELASLPVGLTPGARATARVLGLTPKQVDELAASSAAVATPLSRSLPGFFDDMEVLAALDATIAELRSIGRPR
jgi:hypothetical protein